MSESEAAGKDAPAQRDPFAIMLDRLNEQLSRDVAQKILAQTPMPLPEEEDEPAPSAAAPGVIPSRLPKNPLNDVQRASMTAEAMARATQAMKLLKTAPETAQTAQPSADSGFVASDEYIAEPTGLLTLLNRRRKLLIGLVIGAALAAIASFGFSLFHNQVTAPAGGASAPTETAETAPATATVPAEGATDLARPSAPEPVPANIAAPVPPAPPVEPPPAIPDSLPLQSSPPLTSSMSPSMGDSAPGSGELPQLTPPPRSSRQEAPSPAPQPHPSAQGNGAPCTGARQALGLC